MGNPASTPESGVNTGAKTGFVETFTSGARRTMEGAVMASTLLLAQAPVKAETAPTAPTMAAITTAYKAAVEQCMAIAQGEQKELAEMLAAETKRQGKDHPEIKELEAAFEEAKAAQRGACEAKGKTAALTVEEKILKEERARLQAERAGLQAENKRLAAERASLIAEDVRLTLTDKTLDKIKKDTSQLKNEIATHENTLQRVLSGKLGKQEYTMAIAELLDFTERAEAIIARTRALNLNNTNLPESMNQLEQTIQKFRAATGSQPVASK